MDKGQGDGVLWPSFLSAQPVVPRQTVECVPSQVGMRLGNARMVEIKTGFAPHADSFHHGDGQNVACNCKGHDFCQPKVLEAVSKQGKCRFGCIALSPGTFLETPADFHCRCKSGVKPDRRKACKTNRSVRPLQTCRRPAKTIGLHQSNQFFEHFAGLRAGPSKRKKFHDIVAGIQIVKEFPISLIERPVADDKARSFQSCSGFHRTISDCR